MGHDPAPAPDFADRRSDCGGSRQRSAPFWDCRPTSLCGHIPEAVVIRDERHRPPRLLSDRTCERAADLAAVLPRSRLSSASLGSVTPPRAAHCDLAVPDQPAAGCRGDPQDHADRGLHLLPKWLRAVVEAAVRRHQNRPAMSDAPSSRRRFRPAEVQSLRSEDPTPAKSVCPGRRRLRRLANAVKCPSWSLTGEASGLTPFPRSPRLGRAAWQRFFLSTAPSGPVIFGTGASARRGSGLQFPPR